MDGRNVQSRNEDSKRKSNSIVNSKKNRSMTNHKQSLNSSFNTRNVKPNQLSTRKSSLQKYSSYLLYIVSSNNLIVQQVINNINIFHFLQQKKLRTVKN